MGRRQAVMLGAVAAALVLALLGANSASSRAASPHGAVLQVKPAQVSFGGVHAGDVKQKTVTLTNASGSPVTLSAGWAAGAQLSPGFAFPTGDSCLQAENETLAPGATCTLTFRFAPASAGDASATFAFSTDGWASTAATVTLRAKGL